MQENNLRCRGGCDSRRAFEDDHTVGKISCHNKVVLDDKRRFLGVEDEALDYLCGDDALLRVQEAEKYHSDRASGLGGTRKTHEDGSSIK